MILHLETATKVCSVALSDQGELIAFKEVNEENYSHSENLTCFIEDVLKTADKKMSDLQAISVTSGPGSYTGLRIGVSTAKGLCYALNIPLISVDALFTIAVQMQQEYPGKKYAPMIDARRMEVFNAIYDENLNCLKPISADVIEANSYATFGSFIAAGDGAEKLKEVWQNRTEVTFETSILSSAKGHISLAWEKYQNKNFEDVAYFEPFYLKDFK